MVNSGHHKSGFTIVELIIVVVVIAVLAAVSYVAYGKITDDARASATASELKSLKTSMDIYIARKSPIQKQYPNTIAEVRATNLPKDFLDKTQWEMYSYYGAYQKRGDGVVKGQYRIFSVAERLWVIYFDYKDNTWKMNKTSTLPSEPHGVESFNCSEQLLDDCLV